MSVSSAFDEPNRVDEPREVRESSDQLCEAILRQVETQAAQLPWNRSSSLGPPQAWFDDDDNPFKPEQDAVP